MLHANISQCAIMILAAEELTLKRIPFHAVLARDLSKATLGDVGQGSVAQMVVVDLSTEVELSLGLELVVQALAEHDRRGKEDSESRGSHDCGFWEDEN
jgi:hypothetical protein